MTELIALHPEVSRVMRQFEALELHAARSGREVMHLLAQVASDSRAQTVRGLADEIETTIDALLMVMPAYAPPLNVMHTVMSRVDEALAAGTDVMHLREIISADAKQYDTWSSTARDRIARFGAELVNDGSVVFTYTLSETALRTLREAHSQGRHFRVLITESRPNSDGLVTAAELDRLGISVSLSIDACIGELVSQAALMIVGAEAIMADGSAICKVGTYPAALAARAYGVPLYVLVDTLKFNATSVLGLPMKIDPIQRRHLPPGSAGSQTSVVGHLFDRTPPELIRGIVTEKGVLSPHACGTLMAGMPISKTLSAKLLSWTSTQG